MSTIHGNCIFLTCELWASAKLPWSAHRRLLISLGGQRNMPAHPNLVFSLNQLNHPQLQRENTSCCDRSDCKWVAYSHPADELLTPWIASGKGRFRLTLLSLSEHLCPWMTACRWKHQSSRSFLSAGDARFFPWQAGMVVCHINTAWLRIWSGKLKESLKQEQPCLFKSHQQESADFAQRRKYVWIGKRTGVALKVEVECTE